MPFVPSNIQGTVRRFRVIYEQKWNIVFIIMNSLVYTVPVLPVTMKCVFISLE